MVRISKRFADFGLWLNRLYYKQLFQSIYTQNQQPPSWFDHRIDLYYHWPHNLFWLERGFRARSHMFEGCVVLDLCCGDGFYSRYFYSTIAAHVDAIDKDESAIAHAKGLYAHPKINYQVLDVTKEDFPRAHYDVIAWFGSIEHFSEEEYETLIRQVKVAMGTTGVLVGSTIIVPEDSLGKANWEHQNEFTSIAQLEQFLSRDFSDVQIDLTIYPVLGIGERRSAHFILRGAK